MKQLLILSFISLLPLYAEKMNADIAKQLKVKITKNIPYIETYDEGEKIWVMRIQDPAYKLTDDYTKTSRLCPPFCIQPNKIDENITNIGELELLHFMNNEVKDNTEIIVDARLPSWYQVETIPSAINLPFNIVEKADKTFISKIFQVLGMIIAKDGSWDFTHAKQLAIFCNGVWCGQSKHLIHGLLKFGYPKDHLRYYRGGFQGWKLLGLTTVMHTSKIQ